MKGHIVAAARSACGNYVLQKLIQAAAKTFQAVLYFEKKGVFPFSLQNKNWGIGFGIDDVDLIVVGLESRRTLAVDRMVVFKAINSQGQNVSKLIFMFRGHF